MSESAIQIAIVAHFRRTYEGYAVHVPNGGRRGRLEAIRFKRMGVQPGVTDLIFFTPRGCYVMEVKTETGVLSDAQKKFITALQNMGFDCAIVHSFDEGARAFVAWGLPRKVVLVRPDPETEF